MHLINPKFLTLTVIEAKNEYGSVHLVIHADRKPSIAEATRVLTEKGLMMEKDEVLIHYGATGPFTVLFNKPKFPDIIEV